MDPKTELQKNAIADARRKELETYQRALDIQWLNSRMEDGRMGRSLALIQKEAEMEKDFQERTDHAAIVNERARKETDLGIEIAKIKNEEASQLLRRHYLRERDPSLRELIKKLQAGYVCRDLQQQILHNEYKKLQDKVEEENANRVLLNSRYCDKETRINEERTKIDKNRKYCLELQQQLVNKQVQRQCEYEDTLIEKKMLDEVMRTIADEDQRELKQKQEQTNKLRNEMFTFKKAQEAWKVKQKEMLILEERKIEEQLKAASDRSSSIIAERERKMKEKDEINQKIATKILAEEAAREERQNLIKLLQEQEYLEKNFLDDVQEKDKFERVKADTKTSLMGQMENRKKVEKEMRLKEEEFRKNIEAKMAADDQREIERERKLKEKRQQYSVELRQQIQDNAERRRREGKMEDDRVKYVHDFYNDCIAERERKMKEKDEINQKIAAKILADEAAREERQNLIKLLQEQEYLEKNFLDDVQEKDKFERVKADTKTSLMGQMENRKKVEKEMRLKEEEFRKNIEAKMAADDQREIERERKLKEKRQQYSVELRQQIQDNAERRRREGKMEDDRVKYVHDFYNDWQKEVSQERARIIKQHVPDVLGYVQAGTLQHADLHANPDLQSKLRVAGKAGSGRREKCNAQCRVLRLY